MEIIKEDIVNWDITEFKPYKVFPFEIKSIGKLTLVGQVIINNKNEVLYSCSCGLFYKTFRSVKSLRKMVCKSCRSCARVNFSTKPNKKLMCTIKEGFDTGKGSLLTIPHYNSSIRTNTEVIMECSVCSLDKELFPYGSIVSTIGQVQEGRRVIPCGCTSLKWSERQQRIRILRQCEDTAYEFLGFVGEYKDSYTKLSIMNHRTGKVWDTVQCIKFLEGNIDPLDLIYKLGSINSLTDDCHIKDFNLKGSYKEGTIFERDFNRVGKRGSTKDYWWVSCITCGERVSTLQSTIKDGYLSCDCKGLSGYNIFKEGTFYISVWGDFLKCGITNLTPRVRFLSQKRKSGLNGEIIFTYKDDGLFIRNLEYYVKGLFESGVRDREVFPDGFTETYEIEDLNEILTFVDDIVNKGRNML